MLSRRGLTLLLPLLSLACSDEVAEDAEGGAPIIITDAQIPLDAAPRADRATPPVVDAASPVIDAAPPEVDAAPPECEIDEDCTGLLICFQQRCLDGIRCDPGCPAGRLCVGGLCLEDPSAATGLVVDPDMLIFLFAVGGDERTLTSRVGNQSSAAVEIVGFEVEGSPTFTPGDLALPHRLAPGDTLDLVVNFRADDEHNDSGILHVLTNPPEAGVDVELLSQAKTGINGPCLSLEPARLDFGQVPRGDTLVKHSDLVSCGNQPVVVRAINRGQSIFGSLPTTFALDPQPIFPIVIDPGQRYRLNVAYTPMLSQIEGGYFDVLSDDVQNPNQQLNVGAFAVPPPLQDVALHVNIEWDTDLTDVD
ncbi:hypothetical protein KKF91_05965, partial [Myxococcota bacterium]|nr:hypothetical protein [Myxococcota bacterium]